MKGTNVRHLRMAARRVETALIELHKKTNSLRPEPDEHIQSQANEMAALKTEVAALRSQLAASKTRAAAMETANDSEAGATTKGALRIKVGLLVEEKLAAIGL